MRDAVLDIAVTPDRGYCLSVRGLAREAAAALECRSPTSPRRLPSARRRGYPVVGRGPGRLRPVLGCAR